MISALLPILLRFIGVIGLLSVGQWRRWPLEITLLSAAAALGLSYGQSPVDMLATAWQACLDPVMYAIMAALFSILAFSTILDKTGQTKRLADIAKDTISSTRLRLAFFPALIGLIPMPGGAIVSCPMVREISADMPVSNRYRAMLNLWFRHIWECVWPLYPGFVLACLLGELIPYQLFTSTVPLTPCAIFIGWLFLLRRLPKDAAPPKPLVPTRSWRQAGKEALPLLAGIGTAFSLNAVLPILPGYAFFLGFLFATILCARQNRVHAKEVIACFFTPRSMGIMRVLIAIFIFKAILNHCDLITDISALARQDSSILVGVFVLAPLFGGMFTGLQFGAVGMSLPVLIPLLHSAGLWDIRLPWIAFATMMCYVGQMISPVHVCFVVTSKFFGTSLGSIIIHMIWPAFMLACCAGGILAIRLL